ncbi:MAG TPA: DUF3558 domain-containing protein [Pseudonocardia sp.]
MATSVLAAGLTVVGAISCATSGGAHPEAPSPSREPAGARRAPMLPPRPETLSLARVDPCALLTSNQTASLGITDSTSSVDNDEGLASPQCLWSNQLGPPDNGWMIRLNLKQNATVAFRSNDPLVKVVEVAGFPAVQTYPGGSDGQKACIEVIDVAPSQHMQVFYTNLLGDYPGIDHQVACQLADRVARLALANLRRLGS